MSSLNQIGAGLSVMFMTLRHGSRMILGASWLREEEMASFLKNLKNWGWKIFPFPLLRATFLW